MNRTRAPRRSGVSLLRALGAAAFACAAVLGASLALPGSAIAAGSPSPGTQQLDHGQVSGGGRDYLTFGLQPAYPVGAPPRPTFTLVGGPNTQQRDNLRVSNFSQHPVTLRIYAADARTAPDGGFEVAGSAVAPTMVGRWVRFPTLVHGTLTLPARTLMDVPFVVAVPPNAEPGDHAGALVAAVTLKSRNSNGTLVDVESRVASRLYLRVAGILHPRLEITGLTARYDGVVNPLGRGRVVVSYTIHNTGNVRMAVDQTARLTPSFFGPTASVGNLHRIAEIVPGDSVLVTGVAPSVWPLLRYSAGVTLSPLPVRDAVAANTLDAPRSLAQTAFWAVPWSLLVLLGAVLLLVLLGRWWRRWHRRKHPVGRHARGAGPTPSTRTDAVREPAMARSSARRTARRAMFGALAGGILATTAVGPALGAGGDGYLTFTPPTGKDTTPMYLVTSAPCPDQATNVEAVAFGRGFTSAGQVVVSNSTSGMSHSRPFVLPLQDTMAAYARRLNITLSGPYTVVLRCKPRLASTAYATMTGTMTFHTPHDYTAPGPTDAQVAAVTGEPGAPASGRLSPGAVPAAPGAPAPQGARPSSPAAGAPGSAPGSQNQTTPGSAAGSSSESPSAARQHGSALTSSSAPSSHPLWWVSAAGVLLLALGVLLALRSSRQEPSAPSASSASAGPPGADLKSGMNQSTVETIREHVS